MGVPPYTPPPMHALWTPPPTLRQRIIHALRQLRERLA